ncbi:sulfatase-like hydrolase/transferase [Opitutia bacterium ISCC 51]|nr:sulfatase-like hydrolase/transferase [Opitutae bacterium ISCC 51]QXD27274.1 sulfatase-like hydrolase/transferase [Opitutae bacterium ISCC 52]
MKKLLTTLLVSATLILGVACSGPETKESGSNKRKPNIILIMADDMGYETVGAYGGASYDTPVLDRLAANGVRFDHAHAQPLCTPTRVSLMTGKYNWRNWHSFGILPPESKTFGHWMTAAGYKTCISGKWQLQSYNPPDFLPEYRGLGQKVEDAGFDEYFLWHDAHTEDKGDRFPDPTINDNGTYLTDTVGKYGPDLYVDYINGFMERNKNEPFFVYYPMALPHGPFQPTPDSPEWPEQRHDEDGRYYKDMVDYIDVLIGHIEAKVTELGLEEDTLIIFYGDNGSPRHVRTQMKDGSIYPGGKGHNNLRGTHVPLIVSWPGSAAKGHVVDDLVDCNDITRTLFDVANIPLPEGEIFDGESILPQIKGQKGEHRDWLYIYHDPLPGVNKEDRVLRSWAFDKQYKLVKETGELFDLRIDPEETSPIDMATANDEAKAAHAKLKKINDSMGQNYTPWTWAIDGKDLL